MSLNGSHQLQMVQKHIIDFATPKFGSFLLAVLQKASKNHPTLTRQSAIKVFE